MLLAGPLQAGEVLPQVERRQAAVGGEGFHQVGDFRRTGALGELKHVLKGRRQGRVTHRNGVRRTEPAQQGVLGRPYADAAKGAELP